MTFNRYQAKVLAILPKPSALLSMLGAGLIIHEVLSDKNKRKLTYHRILCAMSIIDFLTSFWFFMGTWAIPSGTLGIYAAAGTEGTCTAQGWFLILYIASPLYSVNLAIYYLLVIKYKWDEYDFLRKKAWIWLLVPPFLFGLSVAFAGLGLQLYHPANLWCFIAPYPPGCSGSECVGRSDLYNTFRWAFYYGPFWCAVLLITFIMASLYYFIVKQQKIILAQAPPAALFWFLGKEYEPEKTKADRDRRFARQAFWYLFAFYLNYVFPTTVRAIQINGTPPFGLLVMMAIFGPLGGFFNYLIYIRPRFLRNKKKHPGWSFIKKISNVDEEDHKLGAFRTRSTMKPEARARMVAEAHYQLIFERK